MPDESSGDECFRSEVADAVEDRLVVAVPVEFADGAAEGGESEFCFVEHLLCLRHHAEFEAAKQGGAEDVELELEGEQEVRGEGAPGGWGEPGGGGGEVGEVLGADGEGGAADQPAGVPGLPAGAEEREGEDDARAGRGRDRDQVPADRGEQQE